jgi:hypothetical protein
LHSNENTPKRWQMMANYHVPIDASFIHREIRSDHQYRKRDPNDGNRSNKTVYQRHLESLTKIQVSGNPKKDRHWISAEKAIDDKTASYTHGQAWQALKRWPQGGGERRRNRRSSLAST